MKSSSFPSGHSVAENRKPHGTRLAQDGEVPFIRYPAAIDNAWQAARFPSSKDN
jgi:hypothetical protein